MDSKIIYPLSFDSNLDKEKELQPYFKYLESAFHEQRIKNIAVTGNFGVGKSSIIHSFEHYYHENERQEPKNKLDFCKKKVHSGFLYISLGEFEDKKENVDSSETDDSEIAEKNDEKDNTQKESNNIERRILLQIYSRFREENLPASSFQLIKEAIRYRNILALFAGIAAAICFMLLLHSQLGHVLLCLFPGEQTVKLKLVIHFILYLLAIVFVFAFVGIVVYRLLPGAHLKQISLKTNNAELEFEKTFCDGYLDYYSMELVPVNISMNHTCFILMDFVE